MKDQRIPPYVFAALLLTALLSVFSIWKRFRVESENRAVAVVAEYETIESLAAAQGMSMAEALRDVKAQGLGGVVITEDTVGELMNEGRVMFVAVPSETGVPTNVALRFADRTVVERVQAGLRSRFGDLGGRLTRRGDTMVLPPVSPQLVRSTSVGLNPRLAATASKAGMIIVARCSNPSGGSSQYVAHTIDWAHNLGASIFLPQGDEVLGRRDAIETLIDSLRRNSMVYASAEFAKIAGDTEMVEKAPDLVVRLHSAQIAELDKLSPVDAVDRYVRAARERNMRVLLLRPLSLSASQPLSKFNEFVRDITQQLIKNGQVVDEPPHVYHEPGLPKVFPVLLGLAIAPVVWFVIASFVSSNRLKKAGAIVMGVLALACITKTGGQAMALLGSMAFPILGFLVLDDILPKLHGSDLGKIVIGFWIVSVVSLVGGLCVAGMLNSLMFYIKASEFTAVKLSVFLPIIVVGVHYFLKLEDWRESLRSPITWGASVTCLCVGAVAAILIARTGNDTGLGPSGGEMIFRNLLDRFLYVRPRTKEFLIGNPFLILGIGMLLRFRPESSATAAVDKSRSKWAGWTILTLMMGAIGQTGIVNTLCHLHIPVILSLARDVEGLVLGCIIGVVIWLFVGRLFPRREAS